MQVTNRQMGMEDQKEGSLLLIVIIIHSKYFPDSDWLKAHV